MQSLCALARTHDTFLDLQHLSCFCPNVPYCNVGRAHKHNCRNEADLFHAGGRKKRSKAEDDKMEYRPEAELVTMDIDQWLEDAAAAPGDAAWPSPEQHAEAQMDPLMVSTTPKGRHIQHRWHNVQMQLTWG